MTITWYCKAKCGGCLDIIWSEHSQHKIECSCSDIMISGTSIERGTSLPITDEEVETLITNDIAYSHIDKIVVQKWQ